MNRRLTARCGPCSFTLLPLCEVLGQCSVVVPPLPAEGGVQPGGVPGVLENMTCSPRLQPPGGAHTTPGHPTWGSRIEGAEGAGNLICGPQISSPGCHLSSLAPGVPPPGPDTCDQRCGLRGPPSPAMGSCR